MIFHIEFEEGAKNVDKTAGGNVPPAGLKKCRSDLKA
jgi:hypothetical protein